MTGRRNVAPGLSLACRPQGRRLRFGPPQFSCCSSGGCAAPLSRNFFSRACAEYFAFPQATAQSRSVLWIRLLKVSPRSGRDHVAHGEAVGSEAEQQIFFRPSGAGEILVPSQSPGRLAVGYCLTALRACDGGLGLTASRLFLIPYPRTALQSTRVVFP